MAERKTRSSSGAGKRTSTKSGSKARKPAEKPRKYSTDVSQASASRKRAPARKAPAKKAAAAKPSKATAGKTTARAKPAPNMTERMEGLQGWMAEIERRQGRMTYFGAAASLLAVIASAAALYLALEAKNDAATKDDLDDLQARVDGVQAEVKQATEAQLKGVNETLGSIDQRLEDLKQKQAQDAADIATLQSQQSSAKPVGGGAKP